MGQKVILSNTTLTDLARQKLPDVDSILPEQGALMLIDPTHPVSPWAAGVPANAATLVNVAYNQAKALIPSGTVAGLSPRLTIGSGFANDGIKSKVERTGKGGLHVLMTQTEVGTANGTRYVLVDGAADIQAFIQANPAHDFYTAFWGRTTRKSLPFASGGYQVSRGGGSNEPWGFYHRVEGGAAGVSEYPVTAVKIGESRENTNPAQIGPFFQDVAINNVDTPANLTLRFLNMNHGSVAADGGKMPGIVMYGFYLEDLTVSGRTYAQVHDLVQGKYNRDVKTGRYAGDTFTDPATMP